MIRSISLEDTSLSSRRNGRLYKLCENSAYIVATSRLRDELDEAVNDFPRPDISKLFTERNITIGVEAQRWFKRWFGDDE